MEGKPPETAEGVRKKTQMYLFTTRTCPNCRIARECLKDVDYQIVDAQEHPELARQFGVMQAPTLVLVRDKVVQKFANASNIRKFVEGVKA